MGEEDMNRSGEDLRELFGSVMENAGEGFSFSGN